MSQLGLGWVAHVAAAALLGLVVGTPPAHAGHSTIDYPKLREAAGHGKVGQSLGATSSLELHAEPARLQTTDGREQIEFDVELTNHLNTDAAAQISYFLVGVHGDKLGDAKMASPRLLSAAGAASWGVETPEKIGDGNYKFRVIAIATDGRDDLKMELDIPFRVLAGRVTPLTAEEWYRLPEVNEAYVLKEAN